MAVKEKKSKKPRKHKVSQGKNSGGGKVNLTEVQKVLISNGGLGHSRLRSGKNMLVTRPKRLPQDTGA